MPSHVSHLESALDGTQLPARTVQTMHADRPLWVRYDLKAVREAIDTAADIGDRALSMWRYRELLPYDHEDDVISLGETVTPIVHCPDLGEQLGASRLFIKDESRLPTGSFKARGMAMAVTMAKSLGIRRLAVPTAGNAGGALAAYAANAGLECFIFMPRDTPAINRAEAALYGAHVFLVDGLITDCGAIVREGCERMGWFDLSTLKEPYRIEGKKTMGLELAEQFGWKLPDVILYPTGGGTGLIGMWKAFNELRELGFLQSDTMPRLVACQSTGCAPIVRAFERGERFAEPWEDAQTIASGLRVPKAVGDFMILDAVRESEGCARAADEVHLRDWMHLACSMEGVSLCPEAATCIGVLEALLEDDAIEPDDSIVIFNTGAAQKYLEAIECELPVVSDGSSVDWAMIEQAAR